ncbi:MAG: dockerin type I repeat-containing protein, partial [Clostridia bacterium]|nr:dockerin type I repeat-containing protein [Clostridia bacterium]
SDFFDLALLSTTMNKFYKTPILLGDANGDKDVNMKDVLLLRRQIAGLETIGNKLYVNADYDGDGELTMKDVLAMRRFIAGI